MPQTTTAGVIRKASFYPPLLNFSLSGKRKLTFQTASLRFEDGVVRTYIHARVSAGDCLMDAKRLKQIEDIYHAALEVSSGERESFFAERCGGDESLRREVESLLEFDKPSGIFIDTPPESLAAEMFSEQEDSGSLIDKEIGHYNIRKLLGVGGMGEVYLAEDSRLNRKVALKLLPSDLTEKKDRLKRFEQEAQASSALNHPNIVTIHEFGTENGSNYIVTEYVEGVTLRERMDAGVVSVNEALDIASQIASALAAAHEAGIIHRDIKPENIMIRRDGIVKVLDFGLAKLTETNNGGHLSGSEASTRVSTIPGVVMGTAYYMAPEQVRAKEIDARADVWSLGVVIYEMLTEQKPFTGETNVEVMSAVLKDEPLELKAINPRVSSALQKIVIICLQKKPERRFHSAHDLGFALGALTTSSSSSPSGGMELTVSTSLEGIKNSTWRLLPWIVAAALGSLVIAAGLYAWHFRGSQPEQRVFRQLNFRREAIFQASFAPDGKTVVYSAATDGNTPEIFTVHPEFPAPQTLGTRGMHLLDVSSKGELAILMDAKYLRHRTFIGTLARMPLVGGSPRQILEGVRHAAWSPDGSQLAIIREVDGKDRIEYPVGKVLYEVSGNLSDLRISLDGGRIAFFEHPVKNDDRGSVNIIDLNGNKTLLSDGYWSLRGLAWSADGSEILFSASESGGDYTIYAVTTGGMRRIVEQAPGGLILQAVAADGRLLAYRIDFRYGVFVHTAGSTEDRDLSWLRTSKSKSLSQDGQFVLFSEDSLGNNYAVCLRKTDGSPVIRLGEGRPMDMSPDGKWIASIIPSKPPQLVTYPVGAGQPLHIERGDIESYSSAQWFRDGKRLLVGGNEAGKGAKLYVQNIAGGMQAVTPEGTRDGRLSPDGKLIIAHGAGGKYFLYPVDGGEPRPVPWLNDTDVVIQWSADSRYWFVYQGSQIPCRVERINVETGRRELFKAMAPAIRTGLLSVRPTFITDDEWSYTYTTYQQVSSLFVTETGK